MKQGNGVTDFYEYLPAEMKQTAPNPSFGLHRLVVPFHMLIIGGMGAGKTTVALEVIKRCRDTFGKIIICTMDADEPLYRMLRSKVPEDQLEFHEQGEVPPLDSLEKDVPILVIFDDLVLQKKQGAIEEYFIRSRKHGQGVSCIYLSQVYFRIPKAIRVNAQYILLKSLSSNRDMKLILSDFSLGKLSTLEQMFRYATSGARGNFLMIDLKCRDPEMRFRKNFLEYLIP